MLFYSFLVVVGQGVVRITNVMSETLVAASVLSQLGSTSSTDLWSEGAWSGRSGWPTFQCSYEVATKVAGKRLNTGPIFI